RHALGTREGADLDLASAPADREMRDGRVLGFARAGGDDRPEVLAPAFVEGLLRPADRARLIDLDQDGVRAADARRFRDPRRVGDEEVVADDLDAVADRRHE